MNSCFSVIFACLLTFERGIKLMKTYIYCCILLLLFSGCRKGTETSHRQLLIQADSLAEAAPDSAYSILKQIEHPEEMADPDFAYWCLISGKAYNRHTDQDKKFLPSLFYERACHYYRKKGTTEQQAFIRLYHGRSYQEAVDYDKAMQIYAEALKDAEAWKEYNAAGMICSYMGDLYQIQYLSDKCKEKYNESLAYFTLTNNQKSIAYAYNELGFEYLYDKKPEEGLTYLLKADSIAQSIQDSILIGDLYYSLGLIYNELNDFTAAEQNLLKALKFGRTKTDSIIAYYALNSVYITSGDFQKARKTLDLGINKQTKDGILHQKYMIEKGEHHFEQALTYLEQYQEAIDSIKTMQNKMHTLEIEERYNMEYTENQKNKAHIAAFRYFALTLIVLTAFMFVIFLHQLMRRRKNSIIAQQREEISRTDGVISHIYTQLQQEKETLKKEKDTLRQTNKQQDANLFDLQRRIDSLHEDLFATKLEKITHIAAIGKKIRKMTEKVTPRGQTLTSKEWKTLINLFRNTFPALKSLLWNPTSPATASETRLSLLAFFKLEAKQESIIMNIAPVSVYKQRTRLRQTLQLEEGTSLFDFFKTYCMEHETMRLVVNG